MVGAAHRSHPGNACRIKHQTIILMFVATQAKGVINRFTTRRVISPQGRDDYFSSAFIIAQHSAAQFVIMILLSL
jgi:hypothetical protein